MPFPSIRSISSSKSCRICPAARYLLETVAANPRFRIFLTILRTVSGASARQGASDISGTCPRTVSRTVGSCLSASGKKRPSAHTNPFRTQSPNSCPSVSPAPQILPWRYNKSSRPAGFPPMYVRCYNQSGKFSLLFPSPIKRYIRLISKCRSPKL